MFPVEVRDHIMLAHSLPKPVFGPAQGMHGATYVVDVAFLRPELDSNAIVVDIGLAHDALAEALKPFRYANLDESMPGALTTTEAIAKMIFDSIAGAVRSGGLGEEGKGIASVRVTLHESHVAKAWYEGAP